MSVMTKSRIYQGYLLWHKTSTSWNNDFWLFMSWSMDFHIKLLLDSDK